MVWLTLPLVLLACGALLVLVAATLLAWGLTHPPRMEDGKALAILHRLSPGDLGLRYGDVSFDVIDEARPPAKIKIAAWWIPAAVLSNKCVILLHGYADAKVGAIAVAPIVHSLGWNVLAIDLRAHGESGGDMTTGGHFERHDVAQVIDQLRLQQPNATRTLVLFGVSMGSAIATQVAAKRDDLAGIVLESFVGSFIFASHAQTHLMGLPTGFIANLSAHIAGWMTGADFHNDTALHAIVDVRCPVLMIMGTEDPYADQVATIAVAEKMPNVQRWHPEGINHVQAMAEGFDEYSRRIGEFLNSLDVMNAETQRRGEIAEK